jgi:hypothetical protein
MIIALYTLEQKANSSRRRDMLSHCMHALFEAATAQDSLHLYYNNYDLCTYNAQTEEFLRTLEP